MDPVLAPVTHTLEDNPVGTILQIISLPSDPAIKERLDALGMRWSPEEKYYYFVVPEGQPVEQWALRLREAMSSLSLAREGTPTIEAEPSPNASAWQQLLNEYKAAMALCKYKPATIKTYASAFQVFLTHFAPRLPFEVGPEEISAWLESLAAEKNFTESYRNGLITAIKFYYGKMEELPAEDYAIIRPPHEVPDPVVLTKEEVQAIITSTEKLRDRCILMLAYGCALRLDELQGLKVQDLNGKRKTISVSRRKSKHEMPLSETLHSDLYAYLQQARPLTWLFEGASPGSPYSKKSFQLVAKQARERAGIRKAVTLTMLRDSCATHLTEAGIDPRTIQDWMGHKNIQSTKRYNGVARKRPMASPLEGLGL